jgi:vitamin B12 transporter
LLRGSAQASATLGATALSLGVSRVTDTGFSAINTAQIPAANPDKDGYRNTSAVFNLVHRLAEGQHLGFGWVHSDGHLDYDSAFATPVDLQTSRTRKDLVSVNSDNQINTAWRSQLSLSSQTDDAGYAESGSFGYNARYKTRIDGLNWINSVVLSPGTTLRAGLDQQRQRIDGDDNFGGALAQSRSATALFGGVQTRLGKHDLALNLRQDHIGGVGSKGTGSLGWGWQVVPAWKLIANLATAFSAPPLGYLYAPYYGNPALQPERARSAELGLQWAVPGQRVRATLFQSRVEDQFQYDLATSQFSNLARTRNRGLELSYNGRIDATDLRASLTSQRPIDDLTGLALLRRSDALASVVVSQDLGAGWRAGLAARYASSRPDSLNGSVISLAAYTVADLTVQWDQTRNLQWFARIENLGNVAYQTVNGYNQPPRGVFAGLRWRLPV